jgi:hypothetical protein
MTDLDPFELYLTSLMRFDHTARRANKMEF